MIHTPRFGIMLSQTWPQSRAHEGDTAAGLERALEAGVFDHFQMVDVPYPAERRLIRDLLDHTSHTHTYCATRRIGEANLSLSSLDEGARRSALILARACLDEAIETGAMVASFVSGSRPERESERGAALDAFSESLSSLCEYSADADGPAVAIEALDYTSDKRMTLGTVEETRRIIDAVESSRLCTCVDLAHLMLNGETVEHALELLADTMVEFHFGNVVMEPEHPLFGDRHLRFGPPGSVDDGTIREVARRLDRSGALSSESGASGYSPAVMCEVLTGPSDDPAATLEYVAARLELAWPS